MTDWPFLVIVILTFSNAVLIILMIYFRKGYEVEIDIRDQEIYNLGSRAQYWRGEAEKLEKEKEGPK